MSACIGQPISWLRLERFALDAHDPSVHEHVASCDACRHCLEVIRRDVVALPALPVKATRQQRRWWTWAMPAVLAAAAVAVLVLVLRPRSESGIEIARVKGVGEVVIDVVRERDGVIREDVRSFAAGDRFKVIVTCPPNAHAWIDVGVVERGNRGEIERVDYPLAPAQIACGNRVVVPGAFTLTGDKPNRVCARIAASSPPPRGVPHERDEDVACVTINPE